jgi:transcriptional regulator with XRE-family HTH domain
MANRSVPIREASHASAWTLMTLGREVRRARTRSGRTQREIGAQVRRSASHISRMERGKVPRLSVLELTRIAAAVGLRVAVNAYPGVRRPLDAPQLKLLDAFNRRIHSSWTRTIEAVMPIHGDMRAVDELIRNVSVSCAVEAITRFADNQGQVRDARVKQRDIGADRLILLLKATHANRRLVRDALPVLADSFPISTRAALRALAAGEDPGGDCLILL